MPTVDQVRLGTTSRCTAMTCAADGRDHLVSDHAMASGLATGHGEYRSVCGHVVVAAPMVAPPGPSCLDCETALHSITTGRITTDASGRSRHCWRGVVTWLLRRRTQSAHS